MPQKRWNISEYRGVWSFVMFDLHVDTQESRRQYTQFRNLLLKLGYDMLQFSVYARYYPSEEASETHRKKIRQGLPPGGQVRVITVTDRQFGKMDVFHGKKRANPEKPPEQMLLF